MAQSEFVIPWSISINGVLSAANSLGHVTLAASVAGGAASTFTNGVPNVAQAAATGGKVDLQSQCSVAFKSSTLDLVTGLNVGLANSNSSIVSELNYLSVLNQIKLLVQYNQDWYEIFGPKLCFAKDTAATYPAIAPAAAGPTSGFAQRQDFLYKTAKITYYSVPGAAASTDAYITSIQCASIIPAHLLHNFLANLDSPDRGIQWRLSMMFCKEFNQQSLVSGFMFAGAAPTTPPTYSICGPNGSAITTGGQTYSNCLMKYRSITLPPAMQIKYDQQILDGKLDKRYIDYVVTDVYDNQVGVTGSLKSYQLSNGIVKPVRLWTMGFVNKTLTSQVLARVTGMVFSSLNCRIGTTNRFSQPLISGYDMYNELQQQMQDLASSPDKGSLLTYGDFYTTSDTTAITPSIGRPAAVPGLCHFTCIDLARTQGRVEDAAVSIIVDGISTSAASIDYLVLVERMQVCRMDRSRNTVSVTVGSLVD
jgi:hypothetical protein